MRVRCGLSARRPLPTGLHSCKDAGREAVRHLPETARASREGAGSTSARSVRAIGSGAGAADAFRVPHLPLRPHRRGGRVAHPPRTARVLASRRSVLPSRAERLLSVQIVGRPRVLGTASAFVAGAPFRPGSHLRQSRRPWRPEVWWPRRTEAEPADRPVQGLFRRTVVAGRSVRELASRRSPRPRRAAEGCDRRVARA